MNAVYLTDARAWLAAHGMWCGTRSYDKRTKEWLAKSGHYLNAPPPGCLVAVSLEPLTRGLFGPVPSGELLGLSVLGRPIARNLPQGGGWAELTRFVLSPGLPRETASHALRIAAEVWFARMTAEVLISYHDRSRHSGCIYKKAGFRKDGVTRVGASQGSWASRTGSRASEERNRLAAVGVLPGLQIDERPTDRTENPSKRRWRLDADDVREAVAARVLTT